MLASGGGFAALAKKKKGGDGSGGGGGGGGGGQKKKPAQVLSLQEQIAKKEVIKVEKTKEEKQAEKQQKKVAPKVDNRTEEQKRAAYMKEKADKEAAAYKAEQAAIARQMTMEDYEKQKKAKLWSGGKTQERKVDTKGLKGFEVQGKKEEESLFKIKKGAAEDDDGAPKQAPKSAKEWREQQAKEKAKASNKPAPKQNKKKFTDMTAQLANFSAPPVRDPDADRKPPRGGYQGGPQADAPAAAEGAAVSPPAPASPPPQVQAAPAGPAPVASRRGQMAADKAEHEKNFSGQGDWSTAAA